MTILRRAVGCWCLLCGIAGLGYLAGVWWLRSGR